LGIAILLVEHHLDHVRRLADVVVAMDQGTEFARGAADDVLDSESVRERYLGEVLS
jgi:branched-chain amino acid transport system ATP-binding protein